MLDFYISTHGRKWNNKGQWLKVECITIQIRDGNVVLKSECSSLVADFQGERWILRMSSRTDILLGKNNPPVKLHPAQSYWMDFYVLSIQKIKLNHNECFFWPWNLWSQNLQKLLLILHATRFSSKGHLDHSEEKMERKYFIFRKFLSVPFF